MQYSNIAAPISSIVLVPSMTGPVSISMISAMRLDKAVLLDTLMVGQTGLPVGVPNQVVNNISVAPDAALPVVASTSLPGVQTRFRPGFKAGSV